MNKKNINETDKIDVNNEIDGSILRKKDDVFVVIVLFAFFLPKNHFPLRSFTCVTKNSFS